jgi:hypothetical protein
MTQRSLWGSSSPSGRAGRRQSQARAASGDPGLSLELLPPGWNGVAAGQVFDTLHKELRPAADEHALPVIRVRR